LIFGQGKELSLNDKAIVKASILRSPVKVEIKNLDAENSIELNLKDDASRALCLLELPENSPIILNGSNHISGMLGGKPGEQRYLLHQRSGRIYRVELDWRQFTSLRVPNQIPLSLSMNELSRVSVIFNAIEWIGSLKPHFPSFREYYLTVLSRLEKIEKAEVVSLFDDMKAAAGVTDARKSFLLPIELLDGRDRVKNKYSVTVTQALSEADRQLARASFLEDGSPREVMQFRAHTESGQIYFSDHIYGQAKEIDLSERQIVLKIISFLKELRATGVSGILEIEFAHTHPFEQINGWTRTGSRIRMSTTEFSPDDYEMTELLQEDSDIPIRATVIAGVRDELFTKMSYLPRGARNNK
jgi:hypothetical protein